MAFRRLEQIRIGNNPPGQIFNGYIYQLSCNLGSGGSPTTVSCQVINEKGNYSINKDRDLSATSPMPIYIGEGSDNNPAVLPTMYLISYQINQSAGGLTLSLEFLDRTIWLDKIYVGLAGKLSMPHNLTGNVINNIIGGDMFVNLPIRCSPCSKGDHKDIQVEKIAFPAEGGFASNVDQQKGGAILIGTTDFASSPCEMRDVSYNWQELLVAMAANGIRIETDKFGKPTLHDRGKVHYRRQHAGASLSKVLGSWAQEFGFQWAWNPFNNLLYGRDLHKGIIDLSPVRATVAALSDPAAGPLSGKPRFGGVVITDYNQSYDLKGTAKQDHLSWYGKPRKIRNTSTTEYKRTRAKNITISDIVPESSLGLGRTYEEFLTSVSLGRYSKSARKLYLYGLVSKKFKGGLETEGKGDELATYKDLEPLGITAAYRFSTAEKRKFINLNRSAGQLDPENEGAGQDFKDLYGDDTDLYLAVYSEELDKAWEEWEGKWADFIGKYYMVEKDVEDFEHCNIYRHKAVTVTNHPVPSETFSQSSILEMPFADLIKSAPCQSVAAGCKSLAAAGEFSLKQICWQSAVGEEAAVGRGSEAWDQRTVNPNNECCSYMLGVANGTRLIRGRTYYFDQSDPSWKMGYPSYGTQTSQKPSRLRPKCGKVGSPNYCVPMPGARYFVVDENGAMADGYEYSGTPGTDGRGTYTVPSDGPETQRVYLKQEGAAWEGTNCKAVQGAVAAGQVFAVKDSYVERFLDIITDSLEEHGKGMGHPGQKHMHADDKGNEVFIFERAAKWGQTKDEMDSVLLDSEKSDFLEKWVPEIRAINEQAAMQIKQAFADMFTDPKQDKVNLFAHFENVTAKGQRPHLIFLPNQNIINKVFAVGPMKSGNVNFNEKTFLKKEKEEKKKKCTLECQLGVVERVCRCFEGITFPYAPKANGLVDNTCFSFTVAMQNSEVVVAEDGTVVTDPRAPLMPLKRWVKRHKPLKLPCVHDYLGYNRYDITDLEVHRSITQSYGQITNAGEAMQFNVNVTDITSDLDNFNPDPAETASEPQGGEAEEQGAGAGLPGVAGKGSVVAPMVLPPTAINVGNRVCTYTTAAAYHSQLLNGGYVVQNDRPLEKVEFTLVGWDWNSILPIFGPNYGMDGFSISYGNKGIQTKFSYSTKFPDITPMSMYPMFQSQLNLNVYGRTF